MLRTRRDHPAFHPYGAQQVLSLHDNVFAVVRTSPDEEETILCLINVTPEKQILTFEPAEMNLPQEVNWTDLISGTTYRFLQSRSHLSLEGYQYIWLIPVDLNP